MGGTTEVVELSETLDAQLQLPFNNYGPEAETFMGTCPDCSSQPEFAEGCNKCHVCGTPSAGDSRLMDEGPRLR